MTMSKIEDRHREFADEDGRPLATGVIAVADSWACTNPSLGRGASIGAAYVALRDLLRTSVASDPHGLVSAWNEVTAEVVEPWYRSTLTFDRHRLNEVHAEIEGERYDPKDDPSWTVVQALGAATGKDGDCLRANLSIAGVETPDQAFQNRDSSTRSWSWAAIMQTLRLGTDRKELVALTYWVTRAG